MRMASATWVSRTRWRIRRKIWSIRMSAQVGVRSGFIMQLGCCRQAWRLLSCYTIYPSKNVWPILLATIRNQVLRRCLNDVAKLSGECLNIKAITAARKWKLSWTPMNGRCAKPQHCQICGCSGRRHPSFRGVPNMTWNGNFESTLGFPREYCLQQAKQISLVILFCSCHCFSFLLWI